MNKLVKTLLAIALSTNFSIAQESISIDINEVIVSSNRASSKENITNVHTISLKEIENAPVQTIEDLLEYAINIDMRQRCGQGVQTDVSMRGGTFEQVLVMLNGVKLNDPQTGHHTMDLPVSLEQVERIEIMTGGASRIFGNYAYTGVINIITKKEGGKSINMSIGENGYINTEFNYNLKIKNTNHNISINNKVSDGFNLHDTIPDSLNMDYKINNFYYQASTANNGINTLFNVGYTDKEFGAFSFYTDKYPNQFEKTKTTFSSLQIKTEGDISIENKLYWRKHNDEFILFRKNPEWYHNFHKTNVFGMDFNIIQKTKTGTNVIGMEIRTDNIISNRLGNDLDSPIEIDSLNSYTKGESRTTTNIFTEKNMIFSNLSISTGIMMNIDSRYGNDFFPGIDLSYKITDGIKIFASNNKSMRAPNYTELYYTDPTNQGNEYLVAEHSTNKELGVNWNNKIHKTTLTFYNRKGEDMIDWVITEGDSIWRTANIKTLNVSGYEFSSKIDINKLLNTNLPISVIGINYSKNEIDANTENFQSKYTIDHLKRNFSLTASQFIGEKFRINWRASYQERAGTYKNQFEEEFTYNPIWLVSSRASYQILRSNTFYLEINNLLNTKYVDYGMVPQIGRWYRVGLKINL